MHKEGKVKKSLDYRLFDQAIKQSEDQVGHLLVMGCKVRSFSLGMSPSSDAQEALRFASLLLYHAACTTGFHNTRQFLAPQSGALRISAYRDFQSNPIQSTYSFRAFKPFYGDQKQCKWTKADQCRLSQTKAGINFAKFYNFQNVSKLSNFQNFQIFQNLQNFQIFQNFQNFQNIQNFQIFQNFQKVKV